MENDAPRDQDKLRELLKISTDSMKKQLLLKKYIKHLLQRLKCSGKGEEKGAAREVIINGFLFSIVSIIQQ
jgi:hypothetical protein